MIAYLFNLLYPYVTYSADLGNIVQRLCDYIENEKVHVATEYRTIIESQNETHRAKVHDLLVVMVLNTPEALDHLVAKRKIDAIKTMKRLKGMDHQYAGLAQWKYAIEDQRVTHIVHNINLATSQINTEPAF